MSAMQLWANYGVFPEANPRSSIKRFQNNMELPYDDVRPPDIESENTPYLPSTQLHQDNCDDCIGKKIKFITKGKWEIAKIVSLAPSKRSIKIENHENKSESAHKMTLNIPKMVNGKRVSKEGRNVYIL